MSDLASSFLPSACSGDMYAAVPTIVPSAVKECAGGASVIA